MRFQAQLFVVAALLHVIANWKAMKKIFQQKNIFKYYSNYYDNKFHYLLHKVLIMDQNPKTFSF